MPGRFNIQHETSRLMLFLQIFDALVIASSLFLLAVFYEVPWSEHYTNLSLLVFVLSFWIFSGKHIYQAWRGMVLYWEFFAIIKAWILVLGMLFFLLFLTKTSALFSRRILLTWMLFCPVIICFIHALLRIVLRALRKRGINTKTAIIVSADKAGYSFYRFLNSFPWAGIKVLGFFDDRAAARSPFGEDIQVMGKFDDLACFLKNNQVDYVYMVLPLRAQERIEKVLSLTRTGGAKVLLVPDLFTFRIQNATFQSLGNRLLVSFNPEQPFKRNFDILFSSLVLFFLSPVFLLIGLLIKMEDRGPVFFRHERITCTGKKFGCLKFRTMRTDSEKVLKTLLASDPEVRKEWEQTFKLKNDPRITKIGQFLRKTSLDELPQFWNVLMGDMSVVGARPIVDQELCDYYKDKAGIYCSIKPGVTGQWQISGRNDVDYTQRVEMDMKYILNRTFWMDLKIIFKTAWIMVTGKGAY